MGSLSITKHLPLLALTMGCAVAFYFLFRNMRLLNERICLIALEARTQTLASGPLSSMPGQRQTQMNLKEDPVESPVLQNNCRQNLAHDHHEKGIFVRQSSVPSEAESACSIDVEIEHAGRERHLPPDAATMSAGRGDITVTLSGGHVMQDDDSGSVSDFIKTLESRYVGASPHRGQPEIFPTDLKNVSIEELDEYQQKESKSSNENPNGTTESHLASAATEVNDDIISIGSEVSATVPHRKNGKVPSIPAKSFQVGSKHEYNGGIYEVIQTKSSNGRPGNIRWGKRVPISQQTDQSPAEPQTEPLDNNDSSVDEIPPME